MLAKWVCILLLGPLFLSPLPLVNSHCGCHKSIDQIHLGPILLRYLMTSNFSCELYSRNMCFNVSVFHRLSRKIRRSYCAFTVDLQCDVIHFRAVSTGRYIMPFRALMELHTVSTTSAAKQRFEIGPMSVIHIFLSKEYKLYTINTYNHYLITHSYRNEINIKWLIIL